MEDDEKFIPRNYQVELMKIAIENNTIIYLPTGSGKTFIAIMVLKHMSAPLLRPYNAGGKITFILVNSIPLVDQHAKYVRDHTTFSVGTFTGEMNLDFWRREKWEEQFNKYQVIVMTSQILLNLVNNNFIDLERVNLLIFDECHRAVENHSMRQLMKKMQCVKEKPRILGLTATLLNGNCKLSKVMEEVKTLEVTYHSKVATVEGLDAVIGYSTNPQEYFEIVASPNPSMTEIKVISHLCKIVDLLSSFEIEDKNDNVNPLQKELKAFEPTKILKKLINLIEDLIIHIEMLGSFGGYIACISHMIQIERIKTHCENQQVFTLLNYVTTTMGTAKIILDESMAGCGPKEKLQSFSSDKVLKLFSIFDEYIAKSKEELCSLVFTKRRFTAKIIHHIIQELNETDSKYNYLKSNFIVGNKNNPYKDTRENLFITKKNKEVLNSFIGKEINVLVCSSVLEEGVDIPKCTLVIRFDKSEDYRSYIQSKGRARHNMSWYCTMLEAKDIVKFGDKFSEYQVIEELLNKFLIGKNCEREPPSESAINKMYNEDKLEPYYVNGPNSAQVNMNSSISLLCRYCQSFHGDHYLFYSPQWYLENNPDNNEVRVVIFLPTLSPILEPIIGPFMSNKKDAKRAAALVACKQLHFCGELDDDLLPFKKDLNAADVSHLFEHWPEEEEGESGNKKKKRLYNKEIASYIKGQIQAETVLYLHAINLNPLYKTTDDYTAIISDSYKTPLKFGLLSPKPLPDNLCKFPLFDSSGLVEIEIKTNVKEITLTIDELTEIRRFHFLIFNDLLEMLQRFFIFDNSGMNSEMLLVIPIKEHDNVQVDFEVILENKILKSKVPLAPGERMNLQVTDENYLGKIVWPWYRQHPTMYLVTKVCRDKSVLSPFPSDNFTDFLMYYNKKHLQIILNPSQPLLQAKPFPKRLGTFKPKGEGGKRKKEKKSKEYIEYLVPELVVTQKFPTCLWLQARFLPALLSRLTYLLRLQELQFKIARDIGVNEKYLQNCPSLQLDENLLKSEPSNSLMASQSENTTSLIDNNILLECPKNLLQCHYNKDFLAKLLEADYYWPKTEEPKDLEREIYVTYTDIQYYETFISHQPSPNDRLVKNENLLKHPDLPAVTRDKKIEEKHLAVLEIEFDNQSPNLCDFYQALTTAEANDIVNLERLETLGDSFLKLSSSLYIFFKFPMFSEGKATTLKGRLVSNKNLFYLAARKNLGGILKNSDPFTYVEWIPPCFCLPKALTTAIEKEEYSLTSLFECSIPKEEQISGILTKETLDDLKIDAVSSDEKCSQVCMCHLLIKQYVGDKTTADSVEALLGAFLLSGGFQSGIKFSEWIGIFPFSEQVQNLIDTTEVDPVINKKYKVKNVEDFVPQWQEFEQMLGYQFKNRGFLLQALTHPSYSPNRLTQSYERLEFLGDAILDFLITCCIYEHGGTLNPGQLTDLRSALVNNNTFASHVVRCGFHKFLLMMNSNLQEQIDRFAEYLRAKNYEIDDEVLILLEEDEMNLAEYVDVPKALGDIFESLAGAVYLDSNKDLKTVWRVFYKLMYHEIDLFSQNVPKNVIRRLYECNGVFPQFGKAFKVENKKTMVTLDFMCNGQQKRVHGFGNNKFMAKRAAAKIALRILKA